MGLGHCLVNTKGKENVYLVRYFNVPSLNDVSKNGFLLSFVVYGLTDKYDNCSVSIKSSIYSNMH